MNPEKIMVEATFDIRNHPGVKQWLNRTTRWKKKPNNLFYAEKSIQPENPGFINDSPVTVVQLKTLTAQLVDFASAIWYIGIRWRVFSKEVLDALCKQTAQTATYHQQYLHYAKLQKELFVLKESQNRLQKEKWDYHQFLADELASSFQPGELETTEQELKLLNKAQKPLHRYYESVRLLQDGETPCYNS